MTTYPLKRHALRILAGSVERLLERFDESSGRFRSLKGGWTLTNQDLILPIAMLYATQHEANPWHGSADLLHLACRGGDAIRGAQDELGRFEFVKDDGSRWGYSYMPWTMYHWLEAYSTLQPCLDDARRNGWQEGLRKAFTGSAGLLSDDTAVHNIATWHAMALFRAGQVFDQPDWRETGSAFIRRVVAAQSPDGTWSEGGGPSTTYNLVYMHALGLYFHFSGDTSVLPCLEQAVTFHARFTYPDGTRVETVDGRVTYHPKIAFLGFAGLLVNDTGRNLIRLMLDNIPTHGFQDAQLPRLAAILPYCPEQIMDIDIPQTQTHFGIVHEDRSLVRKAGPWYACLSAYVVPTAKLPDVFFKRFIMERQNLLSLYHEKTGVLIGGGNSTRDPDFSTFCVLSGRVLYTQPDEARVAANDEGDTLTLVYGEETGCLTMRVVDERHVELSFKALASSHKSLITAGFTVRLKPGEEIRTEGAAPSRIDPLGSWRLSLLPGASGTRWVASGKWRLHLPEDADFYWPVYPFNPYAINNTAPPEQALARAAVPIEPGAPPRVFRLEITS